MDDAFEDETEKPTYTLDEYLDDLEEREMEAEMVLGGDEGDECTYSKGYLKRQALFSCLTCTPEGNAGFCTACSLSCHEGHEIIELWTKRNFRCDCGNSKFGNFICKLQPGKDIENAQNMYNHNFKGTYCTCNRPYPDPSVEEEEEMIQCCVCEDWFHREHLGLESFEKIPVNEEGEPLYEDLICPGCSKACSFLAFYPENIFIAPKKIEVVANDDKGKGKLEEAPSTFASAGKVTDTSFEPVKVCDVGVIKPEIVSGREGTVSAEISENVSGSDGMVAAEVSANVSGSEGVASEEISEKVLSLNKCSQVGSSGTSCQLGFDLGTALPAAERNKAIFLRNNWREVLCRCENCSNFYKQKGVGFLLDEEDSIAEYEKRAKERREERLQKQEGDSLNMFNNLGHVEKVEIMSGIAEMKNEMENFFANRDASQAITSSDIYQLFDNIKKKRRREM